MKSLMKKNNMNFIYVQKMILMSLQKYFSKKSKDIIDSNIKAAMMGYEAALSVLQNEKIIIDVNTEPSVKSELMISGIESLALGCAAGGCDFISAYPMTPSTGVITFLSAHAAELGIAAEQAEDEISAVNMALGAWYAGARAMVSTAGGGFALMCEGVRPTICLASSPTAKIWPVFWLMATIDGSLSTIPLPRTYTKELAVPRSMAMSSEKYDNK